jgi:sugar O-acyltransferase (sialic acid O-acetyltransferase NeuD family)
MERSAPQARRKIVVIGGGGHAKVLISVLKTIPWDVVGYTDPRQRGTILGVSHLGDDSVLGDMASALGDPEATIGVGKVDVSDSRLRLMERAEGAGFGFPVVVSPRGVVHEDVALGAGTVVFDGVVVNSGTSVGRACIFNTNCTVEHDCRIGDNVHVASGATVSGGVSIGHGCMVGAGATLVHGVSICDGCLIGAGAAVAADIGSPGTYVGVPARRVE